MAQVDFVNYFSILFWFFFLFIIFYILCYSLVLASIYSVLFVRGSYYILKFYKIKNKFVFFPKYKNFTIFAENFILSFLISKIYILYANSII